MTRSESTCLLSRLPGLRRGQCGPSAVGRRDGDEAAVELDQGLEVQRAGTRAVAVHGLDGGLELEAAERALQSGGSTQQRGALGDEPEAWGLAALLTYAQSRAPARAEAPWPPLDQQDPALWDRALIAEGAALLRRASALQRPLGRFQLEAAIQAVHCDRARTGSLDVEALVKLYRGLVVLAPTDGASAALAAAEGRLASGAPSASDV